ncbi:uncharacterized protein C8A04DRAFT_11546 [Dichotomopilus funicola]|uniref:DUF3752 domain-containing protein n=1 Tax=Dichotomopilus funicola TaxID=1934379 RepID=A0AAN6ZMY7_9PEZI|nr:hypothetical protein C8A04DRAFT_11546 [Dichotomopilus funicola]
MASIGPQLPPHLQKRKRTPEDDEELGSPPPKASRRDNDDEISLDDDSDGDFGPTVPGSAPRNDVKKSSTRPKPAVGPTLPHPAPNTKPPTPADNKRPIGPSFPPTAPSANNDEIPLDSDDDDTGPVRAPAPTNAGPAPPSKRVLGPAPPPAPLSERPPNGPDSDDDSDDDWGPALPGASANPHTTHAPGAGPSYPSSYNEPATTTATKRDDWMIAPPTSSGARAPDPTKIKARKFASGPRAATDGKPAGISSIWTETPDEKARRLANAVLGREDAHNTPPSQQQQQQHPSRSQRGAENDEDAARVRAYTEQTRGRSLVEEHQARRAAGKTGSSSSGSKLVKSSDTAKWGVKSSTLDDGKKGVGSKNDKAEEEDDDPSKRAFNWEKDMKVGGQISGAQRRELLNRAANFGGRFQSGKFL